MTDLHEARTRFFEEIKRTNGTTCPVCKRWGKRYKVKLNSSMAAALLTMAADPTRWFNSGEFRGHATIQCSSLSIMKHWGLVETRPAEGDQKYSGEYRLTQLGFDFAEQRETLYSHVLIYNDRFLGYSGRLINIVDALGRHFSYHELITS